MPNRPFARGQLLRWGFAALIVSAAPASAAWLSEAGRAWTTADGATLEVLCREERTVALTHPAFADMPVDAEGRLDWYRGGTIHDGMGLDLDRPDHGGALGIWVKCGPNRPDCVAPTVKDAPWLADALRKNWTWHVVFRPPGGGRVSLRFNLAGSSDAIEAACGAGPWVRP